MSARPLKQVHCSFCPEIMIRELSYKVNRCPKCKVAWRKAWAKRNPGILAAAQKRYKLAHSTTIEAYNKRWKQEHPEAVKVHNRRAHKRWRRKMKAQIAPVVRELRAFCFDCGQSHGEERRLSILRRAPISVVELQTGWPCLWGGVSGQRRLYRDLAALKSSAEKQPTRAA